MTRTIIIGDVHGCARELGELLGRIGPGEEDAVYFVGDLVARGPDTPGVLALFREVGGRSVVGNHEARVIEVRRARARGERGPALGPSHEALFDVLSDADWSLLESLPLHLDLADNDARIVHAGVVPGRRFEDHDAWVLTHIRTVDAEGNPSDRSGDESWSARYRGAPHVVFGHDARRGLQIEEDATGLDTACVYGGELTALVVPRGAMPAAGDRRDAIVSVRAHAAYYTGGMH